MPVNAFIFIANQKTYATHRKYGFCAIGIPEDKDNSLRAALVEGLREKRNELQPIFGNMDDIEWFANEVPCSLSGSSIDLLAYHRTHQRFLSSGTRFIDIRYKFTVCELKRGKATLEDAHQLLGYSGWVGDTLAKGEHIQVQPILIASDFEEKVFTLFDTIRLPSKPPLLLRYEYDGVKLTFFPASNKANTIIPLDPRIEKPNEARRNIPGVIKRNKAIRAASDSTKISPTEQEKA